MYTSLPEVVNDYFIYQRLDRRASNTNIFQDIYCINHVLFSFGLLIQIFMNFEVE